MATANKTTNIEYTAKAKEMAADMQTRAKELDAQLNELLMGLPNLPYDDTPEGADEDDNVEIHRWGTPGSSELILEAVDFRVKHRRNSRQLAIDNGEADEGLENYASGAFGDKLRSKRKRQDVGVKPVEKGNADGERELIPYDYVWDAGAAIGGNLHQFATFPSNSGILHLNTYLLMSMTLSQTPWGPHCESPFSIRPVSARAPGRCTVLGRPARHP